MSLFLDRMDSAPLQEDEFSFAFKQWVAVLVSALNEDISDIQDAFNFLAAPQYTSIEIADLLSAGDLVDGILLYDTVLNVYVGMQSGALVQFTTSAYP